MTTTPSPTPTPAPGATPVAASPPRTWKPTTAGVLIIIAGIVNVIIGIAVAATLSAFSGFAMGVPAGLGAAIGVPLIIIGIISLIGGIFAIQRRVWGLGLAGAILALFPPPISLILGILAIIFLAMSKKEFA